jgi:hypothetical protein
MEIIFDNKAHLGDCLFQIHYLNKLIEKNNNIKAILHCNSSYHYQLEDFIIYKNNIFLKSLDNVPKNSVDTWITRQVPRKNEMLERLNNDGLHDVFYVSFFKGLSEIIGLNSPIEKPEDMLLHNKELLVENSLSGPLDFLFINSYPLSGQFKSYDRNKIDKIIGQIKERGSVITTAPNSHGLPCTEDFNLKLMQIGNLSIKCKNIIAINTAPIIACFNIFNINFFDKFLVLENAMSYSYNSRIKNINNIEDIMTSL